MPDRRTRPEALTPSRPTRREALATGLAGAAALALAPPARAAGGDQGDALTALTRAEQDAALAYRDAALPDGLGARLAGQDDEHAKALASHLEGLAMPVPEPPHAIGDLPPGARAVPEAASTGARLRAGMALERALIEGCADRLAVLEEPGTVRTVATVMAGHAQHLAHLERISGR